MRVKINLAGREAFPVPMNFQAKSNRMIAEKTPFPPVQPAGAPQTRTIESTEIFRGQNEVMIRHEGVIYRMKITRQGKLILNK